MSTAELIAELKSLPAAEREKVFAELLSDEELREDLLDSLVIESRRDEPSRPLVDVLKDLGQ